MTTTRSSIGATRATFMAALVAFGIGLLASPPASPAERVTVSSLTEPTPLVALAGATGWINSKPLTADTLQGEVVLVMVWTYTCINSLRPMPYVKAWADKYRASGLVVVGVHSPEFSFEKVPANVSRFSRELGIGFPVAMDPDFAVWRGLDNQVWPAIYLVDGHGRVRHRQFGEGGYVRAEQVIQQLLAETGRKDVPSGAVMPAFTGIEAPADTASLRSGESYVGYARAEGFTSPGGIVRDKAHAYRPGDLVHTDQWSLQGEWNVTSEAAVATRAGGRVAFRFHARDLHMVLGGSTDAPIRFHVRIDGQPPGRDHGTDIDEQGNGTITGPRLYQLIRRTRPDRDQLFEIEFEDAGAQAYVFTFG